MSFEDRERGLEEEYFHRKNQEAIQKLREQKKRVAEEAKAAGRSSMKCPRCDGTLYEAKFEQVMVDICDKCSGTWLDSGELEQIAKNEKTGWLSRLFHSEPDK